MSFSRCAETRRWWPPGRPDVLGRHPNHSGLDVWVLRSGCRPLRAPVGVVAHRFVTTPPDGGVWVWQAVQDGFIDAAKPAVAFGGRTEAREPIAGPAHLPALRGVRYRQQGARRTGPPRARRDRTNGRFEVRTITGGWSESTLTYDNAPQADTLLATSGPVAADAWVEIPVPGVRQRERHLRRRAGGSVEHRAAAGLEGTRGARRARRRREQRRIRCATGGRRPHRGRRRGRGRDLDLADRPRRRAAHLLDCFAPHSRLRLGPAELLRWAL